MSTLPSDPGAPVRHLSVFDAVCIIVGIVAATGIFVLPNLVATNAGNPVLMILAWVAGGLLCFCGALIYAELTTTYPNTGGEYFFLRRAYGPTIGFLFVWARATVIQTGSIAVLAYAFGLSMTALARTLFQIPSVAATLRYVLRPAAIAAMQEPQAAPMIYALLALLGLTACNVIGLRTSKWMQNSLTVAKITGVLAIIFLGLLVAEPAGSAPTALPQHGGGEWTFAGLGFAMMFVLFTFGGWNEAAYVTGELRQRRRRTMLWVLAISIGLLTGLYVLVNLAYLRALGFDGMAGTWTVAADTVAQVYGNGGAIAVNALVAVSALGAIDGCIFTGARAIHAMGRDYRPLSVLGRWHKRFKTPVNAITAQSMIAATLIALPGMGEGLREALGDDLESAVAYTAPAFWAFLMLTGFSVLVLRRKDPDRERPFLVPFGHAVVIPFSLMCGYMLYRSIDYAYKSISPLIGLGVLLMGLLLCVAVALATPATRQAKPRESDGG